jgi:hypothetical protein
MFEHQSYQEIESKEEEKFQLDNKIKIILYNVDVSFDYYEFCLSFFFNTISIYSICKRI